ncbi:MAG: Fe-Mn family superoxide dismutase [Pseudomonadota bacterium]
MKQISRREAIGTVSVGVVGAAVIPAASAQAMAQDSAPASLAFAAKHNPKPLRFDPAKLTGLSEKLIVSHWENNYQGSVRALNLIEGKLAAAMQDTDFPALVYGGLKREELHRTGSVILHEYYFGALGGDGKPGGSIVDAITASFGSFDIWQAEFRRTALSLSGGSGWAVLSYNPYLQSLHNYWAWDHMHHAVTGIPLITLDMYEHSYHMDYGTAATRYIDAFMANLNWQVIDARYRKAVTLTGNID